jgi:hypothetical protein
MFRCLLLGLVTILCTAQSAWVPDTGTREEARRLDPTKLAFVRVRGTHVTGSDWGHIDVSDPALIEQFVSALQHAVIPPDDPPTPYRSPDDAPPLPHSMEIPERRWQFRSAGSVEFHERGVSYKEALGNVEPGANNPPTFYFEPLDDELCYGPRFVAALRALGTYQAKQVREAALQATAIRFQSTDLVEFESVGPGGHPEPVTLPERRKLLLECLQQADERVFMPRGSFPKGTWYKPAIADITLRNGRTVRLYLVIAPLRRAYRNPEWHVNLLKILKEQDDLYNPKGPNS